MSKASCAEVRAQLYVALDVGYIDQAQFDSLMAKAKVIAGKIGALHRSVSRRGEG
jgi:four helix bundle protein